MPTTATIEDVASVSRRREDTNSLSSGTRSARRSLYGAYLHVGWTGARAGEGGDRLGLATGVMEQVGDLN